MTRCRPALPCEADLSCPPGALAKRPFPLCALLLLLLSAPSSGPLCSSTAQGRGRRAEPGGQSYSQLPKATARAKLSQPPARAARERLDCPGYPSVTHLSLLRHDERDHMSPFPRFLKRAVFYYRRGPFPRRAQNLTCPPCREAALTTGLGLHPVPVSTPRTQHLAQTSETRDQSPSERG